MTTTPEVPSPPSPNERPVSSSIPVFIPFPIPAPATVVYAVVFSNYYPLQVDSLWWGRDDAESHREGLSDPVWEVVEMRVR